MKTCTKCRERKALDEFYKHPGLRDGRKASCKSCQRAYAQSAATKTKKNARRREVREFKAAGGSKPRHGNYNTKHNPWGRQLTEDEKDYWRKQFANAGNASRRQSGL